MLEKQTKRYRRHRRLRTRIIGTKDCPRLSVFRSNRHLYLQLINDREGKTLIGLNDRALKAKKGLKKIELAEELGRLIAKKAQAQKIKKVFFDRGGYNYHGRVKAAAEGARKEGLKF